MNSVLIKIMKKNLNLKKKKVKDHCHYIGKFRGVPHNICNLKYKIPRDSCSIS